MQIELLQKGSANWELPPKYLGRQFDRQKLKGHNIVAQPIHPEPETRDIGSREKQIDQLSVRL